jgi:hypothetical protein
MAVSGATVFFLRADATAVAKAVFVTVLTATVFGTVATVLGAVGAAVAVLSLARAAAGRVLIDGAGSGSGVPPSPRSAFKNARGSLILYLRAHKVTH